MRRCCGGQKSLIEGITGEKDGHGAMNSAPPSPAGCPSGRGGAAARTHAILLLTLALWGHAPAAATTQSCPTNTLTVPGATIVSALPAQYLSNTAECTIDFPAIFYPSGSASYNLVSGALSAQAFSSGTCGAQSRVTTHDVFTLMGPASTTPIAFTARFSGSASGGFAGMRVSLREGASNARDWIGLGTVTLDIAIIRSSGITFDLYLECGLEAASYGGGQGAAWLGFPDLPTGYWLESCQGFVAGSPVPVRPTTWGALKTIYR